MFETESLIRRAWNDRTFMHILAMSYPAFHSFGRLMAGQRLEAAAFAAMFGFYQFDLLTRGLLPGRSTTEKITLGSLVLSAVPLSAFGRSPWHYQLAIALLLAACAASRWFGMRERRARQA